MADQGLAVFSISFTGSPSVSGASAGAAIARSNSQTLFGIVGDYIRLMLDGTAPGGFRRAVLQIDQGHRGS